MQKMKLALKSVQPDLGVQNIRASVDYYVNTLGFESMGIFDHEGTPVHAEVANGGVRFMFGPVAMAEGAFAAKLRDGAVRGAGVAFYLSMDAGIDEYYAQVRGAGATIAEEIADRFWGDRTFTVEDPDGYLLMFSQHVKEFPPEMMENVKPS